MEMILFAIERRGRTVCLAQADDAKKAISIALGLLRDTQLSSIVNWESELVARQATELEGELFAQQAVHWTREVRLAAILVDND